MRKIFVMSVLALAVAGCTTSQSRPLVRDVTDDVRQTAQTAPQYTVKSGDTLYGIAWEHNLDYRNLAALNDIAPPYNIYPGQTIRLRESARAGQARGQASPAANASGGAVRDGLEPSIAGNAASGGAQTQQVDWLLPEKPVSNAGRDAQPAPDQPEADKGKAAKKAAKSESDAPKPAAEPKTKPAAKTSKNQVAKAGQSQEKTAGAAASTTEQKREQRRYTPAKNIAWQWPVNGEVVGRFDDEGSITAGIDIAGEKGQSVKAAGPGIVVYAGSGVRGYGNLVLLKHNDQFLSAYAHNDSLSVSENDVVKAGETIATMGDSDAENVRLHFEVRKDGEPQDPLTYLPSR
ncbi:hypothetical protein GCM10022228_21800 [Halomonas cibimaris]|uniref:LysM domain-containing protein n=1 Tax=Halomonas cibimaris TaxID=657012 RepID=A0ABP7LZ23_9GAMM